MPRWQPPHPDPAKGVTAPDFTSRRTRDAMRQARDSKGYQALICTWFECSRMADHKLGLPICAVHAHAVVSAYKRHITDPIDEERAARKQALDASTAKLDAGEQLTKGDPVPGWIYYILNGDTIKIGYATNVEKRMRAYPPNVVLLAVEPGTKATERGRHNLFREHLAHGREWFRDVPEIRAWIEKCRERHGNPSHMAYQYTTPLPRPEPVVGSKHNRGVKKTAA